MEYQEDLESSSSLDCFGCSRTEMLEFIPSSCKVLLDVGCGAGKFGGLVKQTLGAEVWGVDPSHTVAGITPRILDHFINDFFRIKLACPENTSIQ
ncbi:MAG: class I SAM-dependent methyltransferase [Nitrospirota bacterium]|nr:class I SAM-dependent methyltransferase [Nitrospirota bacterium]